MSLQLNEQYKFVKLQMAAEAFLIDDNGNPHIGRAYIDALNTGNNHSSKFTAAEAANFAGTWEVVAQESTNTGFSGTLFKCIKSDPATGATQGELIMSFRSTEFIDDAVRDNIATNELESRILVLLGASYAIWKRGTTSLAKKAGPCMDRSFRLLVIVSAAISRQHSISCTRAPLRRS